MTEATEGLGGVLSELGDLADLAELQELDDEPDLDPHHDFVSLVLVVNDGQRWIEAVLGAVAGQTRKPNRVVCVDTGSTDGAADRVRAAWGEAFVVSAPPGTGFGAAVAIGLRYLDTNSPKARDVDAIPWVWLLHDDSAPEPEALERLLRFAATSPSATVLGPKQLYFDDRRVIAEVGLTTDKAGRLETGLERRELDQGQHDSPRDVLAVGSAGMLTRRSVWDQLGGFDGELDFARDDLDFCWRVWLAGGRVVVVPSAIVLHARAASRGLRHPAGLNPERRDRRNGAYVVLANATPLGFILGLPRLAIGVLARSIGHLLTRAPHKARSDIAALPLLLRPGPAIRARRHRAPHVVVDHSAVDGLLASRTLRLRSYLQAGADWVSGSGDEEAARTGYAANGADDLDGSLDDVEGLAGLASTDETSILRRLLRRPALFQGLVLAIFSLVAVRTLLGNGALAGGRLLPIPAGSGDLWSSLFANWHDVGAGSGSTAPLWTAPLALLSTITLGKPWVVVDLLLIGLPVLASAAVWRATRDRGLGTWVRTWASAAYALSPPTIATIAWGRFDVAVAIIAAPLLVLRVAGILAEAPGWTAWNKAWSTGLWLALAASFWPPIWTLMAPAVLVVAVFSSGRRRLIWRALAIAAVPVVASIPAGLEIVDHPQVLLTGWGIPGGVAGVPATVAPDLTGVIFMHPVGAPGPFWLLAPLLVAAGVALSRRSSSVAGAVCALAAALAAGFAVLASRTSLGTGLVQVGSATGPLAMAALALIAAAVLASNGLVQSLSGRTFSWRQPAVAILAITAALIPVVMASAWVIGGHHGPLGRGQTAALPPFATAETARTPDPRVLFLDRASPNAPVRWAITSLGGPVMGDEDYDDTMRTRLEPVIADLASPRGTDAGELLSTFAIAFVATPTGTDQSLVNSLDLAPALSRVAYAGSLRLWKPTAVTGRVLVVPPTEAATALAAPDSKTWSERGVERGPTRLPQSAGTKQPLQLGVNGGTARIGAGPAGRIVLLAVPHATGWQVTYNGKRLNEQRAWGWAAAYALPTQAGELHVTHKDRGARVAGLATLAALLLILVLAAPELRRPTDEEPVDAPTEEPDPEPGDEAAPANVTVVKKK